MVGAAVAERQLEGRQAERQAEQLVAEADAGCTADHGRAPAPWATQSGQGRGVAGAVAQEDAVGPNREDLRRPKRPRGGGSPALRACAGEPDDRAT